MFKYRHACLGEYLHNTVPTVAHGARMAPLNGAAGTQCAVVPSVYLTLLYV